MKKIISILAIAATFVAVSCKKGGEPTPEKKILETSSITPAEGEEGTIVTIAGKNFEEGVEVFFGEVKASVTASTATSITAVAPANEPGECVVKVILGEQTAQNLKFTYLDTKVSISSISAQAGYDQDELKIVGKNFSAVAGLNTVEFGESKAVVTAATPTELTVEVPYNDAGTYDVKVTVNGQTAVSPSQFKYNKDVYYCTADVVNVSSVLQGEKNVYDVFFLSDNRLAIGTRAGEVCLVNVETGASDMLYSRTDGRRARGFAQNSDKSLLYVAFQGHSCVRWMNIATKEVGDLVTGLPSAMKVKFDKDDNMYVCTADEGNVYKYAKGSYSKDKSADENNAGKTLFAHFDGVIIKDMEFDAAGNLIVAVHSGTNSAPALFCVDPSGNSKMIAGSTTEGATDINTGEYRQPLSARFKQEILGLTVDNTGRIWVSDASMGTYVIKPGKKGYEDAVVSFVHSGSRGWVNGSRPESFAQNVKAEGIEVYIADYNNGGRIHKAKLEVE